MCHANLLVVVFTSDFTAVKLNSWLNLLKVEKFNGRRYSLCTSVSSEDKAIRSDTSGSSCPAVAPRESHLITFRVEVRCAWSKQWSAYRVVQLIAGAAALPREEWVLPKSPHPGWVICSNQLKTGAFEPSPANWRVCGKNEVALSLNPQLLLFKANHLSFLPPQVPLSEQCHESLSCSYQSLLGGGKERWTTYLRKEQEVKQFSLKDPHNKAVVWLYESALPHTHFWILKKREAECSLKKKNCVNGLTFYSQSFCCTVIWSSPLS